MTEAIYFLLEHVPVLDFADAIEVIDYKEKYGTAPWRAKDLTTSSVQGPPQALDIFMLTLGLQGPQLSLL